MIQDIYGKEYLAKYKELGKTQLSREIHWGRWALIKHYMKSGKVLDFGCGPGTFASHKLEGFQVDGYDVNPESGANIYPMDDHYDCVTFWDSLEHIPDFYQEIDRLAPKWLFITTPNLASVKKGIMVWRHYRPEEHLFYFDQYSLKVILRSLGYAIKEINFDEGALRNPSDPEAILTVVAERLA